MFIMTETKNGRQVTINLDNVKKFKPAQYGDKNTTIVFYVDGTYELLGVPYTQIQEKLLLATA